MFLRNLWRSRNKPLRCFIYFLFTFILLQTLIKLMRMTYLSCYWLPEFLSLTKQPSIDLTRWPYPAHYCEPPTLVSFSGEIKDIYEVKKKPACSKDPDWVMARDGRFVFRSNLGVDHPGYRCKSARLIRKDDWKSEVFDSRYYISNGTIMSSPFMFVNCTDNNGKVFKSLLATFKPSIKRIRESHHLSQTPNPGVPRETPYSKPADIILLGFDSVSRASFKRNMPKTYEYFTESLGGIPLTNANIFAEGTVRAMLPILTGRHEYEQDYNLDKSYQNSYYCDKLPWIFKDYSKAGYLTGWTEDNSYWGTFQYRMYGFKKEPTDFYGRSFQVALEQKPPNLRKRFMKGHVYCDGSELRFKKSFLDSIDEIQRVEPDIPKFAVMHSSKMTHNNNNYASIGIDELTLDLLKRMKSDGRMDNTIFVLYSDHGDRFGPYRTGLLAGSLEERNPLLVFRFPKWFHEKHPQLIQNLRENSMASVLTTHFDFHATLHHLLKLDQDRLELKPPSNKDLGETRGYSLLQPIPRNRTCNNAGIKPFWCNCIPYKLGDPLSVEASKVAQTFADSMNEVLSKYRQCTPWSVKRIDKFLEADYPDDLAHFKAEVDIKAEGTKMTQDVDKIYLIRIWMTKGGAAFEVSASRIKGSYQVDLHGYTRVTSYAGQSSCVFHKFPFLRAICYCTRRRIFS